MKLHEYQAKQLFASAGIPVPRGAAAKTPAEAAAAYETLRRQCLPAPRATGQAGGGGEAFACNVKAQLHAGGRGKAGGVQIARSASEASTHAAGLLGRRLVTAQTGPEGLPVSAVLVDERIEVRQELYLAVTVDRFHAQPLVLASRRGGVDIEAVAATTPAALHREPFDVVDGPQGAALDRIASALGLSGDAAQACRRTVHTLWTLFTSSDASLIEINPLVVADDGRCLALDAKVVLDDNALFRHAEFAALRDESQEAPLELKAARIGISYVGLDGDIGCLVNGAGLAMATNDIITLAGGRPANFLDVGGGANVEQVTSAFAILLADPRVRAILVNIFGGIMRCDWIAQGLLNATQQLEVRVPIVVRLQGTNVEEGRRLLKAAKRLNLISVDELADAAKRAVELAAKGP
ncbi:MAG: ADP-forming succinate--CoA ligase subunit beta [Candidatus Omnitrophica bacterium]|nr:ADP-forming succinate--CoA ligase subunit beta [Candidatus Omnitrophota bacterium]